MNKVININELSDLLDELKNVSKTYEGIAELTSYKSIKIDDADGAKKQLNFDGNNGKVISDAIKKTLTDKIDEIQSKINNYFNSEPSIVHSIRVNHFNAIKKKKWDYTYWFVDIHSTILKPTYKRGDIGGEYYAYAKEVLQGLTKDKAVKLVMYTCSHPEEIKEYIKFFENDGILFDFVNENPDVKNDAYGNYEKKPYINVLLDDKAGFDAWEDWEPIAKIMDIKI